MPAHGTADVTVTATRTRARRRQVLRHGRRPAGGEQVARTAIGLVKERERYDLDISTVDRQGEPGSGYVTLYRYGDNSSPPWRSTPRPAGPDPAAAPGLYNVTSWLPVEGPKGTAGVACWATRTSRSVRTASARSCSMRGTQPDHLAHAEARATTYRRPGYFHDSGIDRSTGAFVNQYTVSPAIDNVYANPLSGLPGEMEFVTRWRRTAPLLEMAARDAVVA